MTREVHGAKGLEPDEYKSFICKMRTCAVHGSVVL
jgi:hypothetical protein